jgi:hypothetical protein
MKIVVMKSWGCVQLIRSNDIKFILTSSWNQFDSPNFRSTSCWALHLTSSQLNSGRLRTPGIWVVEAVKYAHENIISSGFKLSKWSKAVIFKKREFSGEALSFGLTPRYLWIYVIIQGADALARQHLTWLPWDVRLKKKKGKSCAPDFTVLSV